MFLTKECDYAIRVVRDLADLEIKPVKMICDNEHIPIAFAYKVLKKLDKAGIVRAYRGASGGYQLAKNPDSISLLEIVCAIDDQLFLNACLKEGHVCSRNEDGESCKVHLELEKVQALVIEAFKATYMTEVV